MKKGIWLFLFLALGCAKKEFRVLRVGTDTTYPPMEYKDVQSGKITGFDIDLMDSLGGRMGYQVEYIEVPFDGIVAGLKTGKYDAIISSFTITPEREAEVDFTRPYMNAGQSIAVRVVPVCIGQSQNIHAITEENMVKVHGRRQCRHASTNEKGTIVRLVY